MAKKKRGRPPGSRNRKSIGKSVATMDVSQLRAHIDGLQSVLAKKIHERRAYFEDQLSQLGGYVAKRASQAVKLPPRRRSSGGARTAQRTWAATQPAQAVEAGETRNTGREIDVLATRETVASEAGGVNAVTSRKRAQAKPKYQSKKNKSLKWSGRGVTPVWMREEMKGTKLKKEDFAIKR